MLSAVSSSVRASHPCHHFTVFMVTEEGGKNVRKGNEEVQLRKEKDPIGLCMINKALLFCALLPVSCVSDFGLFPGFVSLGV